MKDPAGVWIDHRKTVISSVTSEGELTTPVGRGCRTPGARATDLSHNSTQIEALGAADATPATLLDRFMQEVP
jgi:hypothetical protein